MTNRIGKKEVAHPKWAHYASAPKILETPLKNAKD